MTYFEKLKDPRWQKLRLKVFERDGWACQICKSKDKTLNAHHRYYTSKTDPWDYPIDALSTLCEACHEEATDHIEFLDMILKGVWSPQALGHLGNAIYEAYAAGVPANLLAHKLISEAKQLTAFAKEAGWNA